MKVFVSKLKRLFRKVRALFPTPLPQGLEEFNKWSDDILELYSMPNNDSMKFALATMILHADQVDTNLPKRYFGLRLQKGAANQVAGAVMQDLKQKQQEKAKTEATATPGASDGPQQPRV